MTTPKNPQGQYQVPQGYRPQTQAVPWSGAYKGSQPRIRGVTPLQAAAISNDRRVAGGLGGGKTSKQMSEEAQDQEAAHQAKRSTAFEKGYQNYRQSQGMGVQKPAPAPLSPDQTSEKNYRDGGLQPDEAKRAVQMDKTKAATSPPPPAALPAPAAAPAAPMSMVPGVGPAKAAVAPAPAPRAPSTVIGTDGKEQGMADFLAASKQRQTDPNALTPQGTDATSLSAATEHVQDIQKANAPVMADAAAAMRPHMDPQAASAAANEASHDQQVRDQIYPEKSARAVQGAADNAARVAKVNQDDITALGKSMRPDTMTPSTPTPAAPVLDEPTKRAMGGPVTGVRSSVPPTWIGGAPPPPGTYPAARPVGTMGNFGIGPVGAQYGVPNMPRRKKGGPTKNAKNYQVGETKKDGKPRPELFMPNSKDGKPMVVGQDGPEVGQFEEDGTIIPHDALQEMKKKYSKAPDDDEDDQKEPPAMEAARNKMRPQAA